MNTKFLREELLRAFRMELPSLIGKNTLVALNVADGKNIFAHALMHNTCTPLILIGEPGEKEEMEKTISEFGAWIESGAYHRDEMLQQIKNARNRRYH
jgi:hypothetical protein